MMICIFNENSEVIVNLNHVTHLLYKDETLTIFYSNETHNTLHEIKREIYEQIKKFALGKIDNE